MSTVFVIGGGLAGLSTAVAATRAGRKVVVYEGAGQAGGRCRSYYDATLDCLIDNGNHLVLSGNPAVQRYLSAIGSKNALAGPERAEFHFTDLSSGARWTWAPNDGPVPWWIFAPDRRVPGTAAWDYVKLAGLLAAGASAKIADFVPCGGPLWDRLMRPLLLAVLNTAPEVSSAKLATAVLRETMAKGGRTYRPRIADPNLGAAFIDPALAYLSAKGVMVHYGQRLRRIVFDTDKAMALEFPESTVPVSPDDVVVLAVPPWVASTLLPGLTVPDDFRAIVNAHFKIAPPVSAPAMLGVIGGTAEWIFTFPERISVTVSGADAIVDRDREDLARTLWDDVARALSLPAALPVWQIVKEKRATFAATPEQAAKRPQAKTAWSNLVLAGDWTDTGLPATIEGALRSGEKAAQLACAGVARR